MVGIEHGICPVDLSPHFVADILPDAEERVMAMVRNARSKSTTRVSAVRQCTRSPSCRPTTSTSH
jgi:hypothetical protein